MEEAFCGVKSGHCSSLRYIFPPAAPGACPPRWSVGLMVPLLASGGASRDALFRSEPLSPAGLLLFPSFPTSITTRRCVLGTLLPVSCVIPLGYWVGLLVRRLTITIAKVNFGCSLYPVASSGIGSCGQAHRDSQRYREVWSDAMY